MNKKRYLSFLILVLAFYLISIFPWAVPAGAVETPAPAITISNLDGTTPAVASTVGGEQIYIKINDTFSNNLEVWFNGNIRANNVLREYDNRLKVTVPAAYDLNIPGNERTVEVLVKDLENGKEYFTNTGFAYRKSIPDFASVSPMTGTGGTMVTLSEGVYGEFFRDVNKLDIYFTVDNNRQYVTDKDKIIIENKTITFSAPPGSIGEASITVENSDGGKFTKDKAFKYEMTPKIESITPNHGAPGTEVRILGPNININTIVKFGGVEVKDKEFIEPPDGGYPGLEVRVPSELGIGTVDVEVKDANTGGTWVARNAFNVTTEVKPIIDEDGISPSTANRQGGTLVTIKGKNFFVSADGVKPEVFFGEVKADDSTVRVVSVNEIEVETPAYPINDTVLVYIKNYDGNISNKVPFKFEETIGIDFVTPNQGSVEGETPVRIKGYNFPVETEGTSVKVFFGGSQAKEAEVLDSQTIRVITPKGAVGTPHDIIVQIVDSAGKVIEQAIYKGGFTYIRPESVPKLISIKNPVTNDNTGPRNGGVEVEVIGEDIIEGAIIYFGYIGEDAPQLQYKPSDIVWESTQEGTRFKLKGILPKVDVPGPYDVILWNPDGATAVLRDGFVFKGTSMWLSSITPEYGPATGGTPVTLWGSGFKEGNETPSVLFIHESTEAPIPASDVKVSTDGRTITAKTPEAPPGKARVVVKNSFGETTNEVFFIFLLGEWKPEIKYTANVDEDGNEIDHELDENGDGIPDESEDRRAIGPASGGTRFTIVGEKFVTGALVTVGGKPATHVDVYSPERIYATSPALEGSPGFVDVSVINRIEEPATGEIKEYTGTLDDGFFYYSDPKITNVSPRSASIHGGNIITVVGEQFYEGAKIRLIVNENPIEEEIETYVIDRNTLRFRVPERNEENKWPEGTVTIELFNTDGGSAKWEQFAFITPEQDVKIDQIMPQEGPDTGNITTTITGSGFEPDAMVYFGMKPATRVEVLNDSTIVAVAPAHEPGFVDVTVTNIEDASTAVRHNGFQYKTIKTAPYIDSVTPAVGPVNRETTIVITGGDFWRTPTVYIGPFMTKDVKWVNENTVTAVVYGGKVGSYDVILTNPDGATAYSRVQDGGGFTFKEAGSKPQITEVTPEKAITDGGTIVTIKGTDFRTGVKVYFGNQEATVLELDDSKEPHVIYVRAPAHPVGKAIITVLNNDGGVAQYSDFEYVLPESHPEIFRIEPNEGPMVGGTKVTIYGDDFRKDGLKVYFGGQAVRETDVNFIRYDQIEVTTPPSKIAGKVDVTVLNETYPGSTTLYGGFEYLDSTLVTSIVPNEGSYLGGTEVTITGQNLYGDASVHLAVYIGDWEADVISKESNQIKIITPPTGKPPNPSNIGWWDVKLVYGHGVEIIVENGFRYLYPDSQPVISKIDPDEGPTTGGLPITITGTDFRENAKVVIGGKEAKVVYIDDSRGEGQAIIKAIIPPHTEGPKKVVVINYDGASSDREGEEDDVYFVYRKPLSSPEIHSVEPAQGPTLGDTKVIITGIWFKVDETDGPPRVWFGMNEAPHVEFIDYKTLRVTTPPGDEGNVDVLVLNPDMGQAILPDAFRYIKVKELVIDKVEPNEGTAEGGTEITITGGPFDQGAVVTIGGNPALDIVVVNSTTITAVTPSGDIGWQEVRVINPDGGWAAMPAGFFYIKPRTAPEHPPGWVDTERKDRETIEVRWEPVEFANYYEIWVSNRRNGQYRFLDSTDRTVYYATGLDYNTTYYFQIRAVNELGVSDFSYYESARTGSGRQQETNLVPEKIIMETANGNATATIATANALAYSGYRIDFTQAAYQNTNRKAVRISQKALSQSYLPITVEAPGISLSVPSSSIYLGLLAQDEDYAEIIITDLGQQVAERAMRELPRGSRIISPVYEVGWQILKGTNGMPQSKFHQQVQLTMKYNVSITPGKQVSLYTYNPTTGRWVNTGAANNPNAPQLTLGIVNPGRFMLVEH